MTVMTTDQLQAQAAAKMQVLTKKWLAKHCATGIKHAEVLFDFHQTFSVSIEVSEASAADASKLSQFIVKHSDRLIADDHGVTKGQYLWDANQYLKPTIWATFKP